MTRKSVANDGLSSHVASALAIGGVVALIIHFVVFDGAGWDESSAANLRGFASTVAQIAAGLAALMFAGLALQLAVPNSSALGMLRTSGHFYALSRRLGYAMGFWLALVAAALLVMLLREPAAWQQVLLIGGGAAGLVSTLDAMHKLLKLVAFSAREFDSDYMD